MLYVFPVLAARANTHSPPPLPRTVSQPSAVPPPPHPEPASSCLHALNFFAATFWRLCMVLSPHPTHPPPSLGGCGCPQTTLVLKTDLRAPRQLRSLPLSPTHLTHADQRISCSAVLSSPASRYALPCVLARAALASSLILALVIMAWQEKGEASGNPGCPANRSCPDAWRCPQKKSSREALPHPHPPPDRRHWLTNKMRFTNELRRDGCGGTC